MAAPADAIFVDGEVHTLAHPDRTAEAFAVRDGTVVRVADTYEVEFLEGIETTRIDLDGRPVIPGFVDANAHLLGIGLRRRRADLSGVDPETARSRLRADADRDREWIVGVGSPNASLDRTDLDAVSETRPVVVISRDRKTMTLNSAALAAIGHEPVESGVVEWPDSQPVWGALAPDRDRTRDLIEAGIEHAHRHGVTAVQDDVLTATTARAYQDLDRMGALSLRVQVDRRPPVGNAGDPIAAARTLGIPSGAGNDRLRMGAIRVDVDQQPADESTLPSLAALNEAAAAAGLTVRPLATDEQALDDVLSEFEDGLVIDRADRVRDDQIRALAERLATVVASPGRPDSADSQRGGRYGRLHAAGVSLALGSDGFSMAPFRAIERLRSAPGPEQRLAVTEALRAGTRGGPLARGGSPGTIEVGAPADVIVLSDSPWERPASDVSVDLTVVDGELVYERP
ncbi:amidohydrolase family protein [Halodesulfurarchaeum sp. HSR-GB]|uniref:amidohydrolase family protein n=1 Tax=Halodesulfurarchaeum sp. HSR-GB TaxID=3074077 RepID=UPI00285D647C|nr:amidohydrolase family protein [Halodesulfurarchaeum sp. HSR-GB]MDR5656384.1 amidohydrolase family protein [Halodesulfurarchaeum sp. HSR-GB]